MKHDPDEFLSVPPSASKYPSMVNDSKISSIQNESKMSRSGFDAAEDYKFSIERSKAEKMDRQIRYELKAQQRGKEALEKLNTKPIEIKPKPSFEPDREKLRKISKQKKMESEVEKMFEMKENTKPNTMNNTNVPQRKPSVPKSTNKKGVENLIQKNTVKKTDVKDSKGKSKQKIVMPEVIIEESPEEDKTEYDTFSRPPPQMHVLENPTPSEPIHQQPIPMQSYNQPIANPSLSMADPIQTMATQFQSNPQINPPQPNNMNIHMNANMQLMYQQLLQQQLQAQAQDQFLQNLYQFQNQHFPQQPPIQQQVNQQLVNNPQPLPEYQSADSSSEHSPPKINEEVTSITSPISSNKQEPTASINQYLKENSQVGYDDESSSSEDEDLLGQIQRKNTIDESSEETSEFSQEFFSGRSEPTSSNDTSSVVSSVATMEMKGLQSG